MAERERESARGSVVGENALVGREAVEVEISEALNTSSGTLLTCAIAGRDQLWGVWEGCAPAQRRGQNK
jgi:hypothetical protein